MDDKRICSKALAREASEHNPTLRCSDRFAAAGCHGYDQRVPDCVFCKIAAGDLPAERVLESHRTIAFRDINPQAPVHVLVIPKEHYPDAAALAGAGGGLLAEVVSQAHRVAVAEGVSGGGYRLVFNTGSGAGQTVFHAHAHVLGGRAMRWPPG
jgi:histidine triad (HIT) family protein